MAAAPATAPSRGTVIERRRAWLATWAVPVVAIAIAITQVLLASTGTLSPWKGGGFGMFSTIDDPPSRTPRADVTTSTGATVHLDQRDFRDVSRGAQRAHLDVRAFPDPRRLAAYRDELCAHDWERTGTRARPTERDPAPGADPCADGLHVDGLDEGVTVEHLHVEVVAAEQRDGAQRVVPRTIASLDERIGPPS